jgi:Flp pilus assembly pilin Flp
VRFRLFNYQQGVVQASTKGTNMERLHNALQALAVRLELVREEQGQALIEYALIISLIALVAIAALQTTGTDVSSILNTIAGEV